MSDRGPLDGRVALVTGAASGIGRFLEPEEIASTVAFLVGPGGDGYVGQVLSPNGGTVFIG